MTSLRKVIDGRSLCVPGSPSGRTALNSTRPTVVVTNDRPTAASSEARNGSTWCLGMRTRMWS